MQTNELIYRTIDPAVYKNYIDRELVLLKNTATVRPDVVVLPEASDLTLRFRGETPDVLARIFHANNPALVIDSGRLDLQRPSKARLFFYDTEKGLVAVSDKVFLVPNGEYLAYTVHGVLKLFGMTNVIRHFNWYRRIYKGEVAPFASLDPRRLAEGVQLCTTIFSPVLWRETANRSQVLINAASVGLLNHPAFHAQSRAMLQSYAAMNDRWVVQAANGGYSYIIDETGAIRARTNALGDTILTGDVDYRTTKTPYVRFGDWPVALAGVLVALLFLYGRRRTQRRLFGVLGNEETMEHQEVGE